MSLRIIRQQPRNELTIYSSFLYGSTPLTLIWDEITVCISAAGKHCVSLSWGGTAGKRNLCRSELHGIQEFSTLLTKFHTFILLVSF